MNRLKTNISTNSIVITEDCDDNDNAAAEFTFTKQNFVTNSKLIQRCFVQTQKNLTMIF